jgi:hypothetical protein
VLTAIHQGKSSEAEVRQRLFLANLYLGLYYDVRNDRKLALEYTNKAADESKAGGYMGHVARMHLAKLRTP